jgi:lipopolysaccharide export system permease protein
LKTLNLMLLAYFARVFAVFLLMFVLVFELMDVFSNLWRYVSQEVSLLDIGRVALLYLPKCVSYALPVALLFSVAYSLGAYYMNNELVSIFLSGISLVRFVTPLLVLAAVVSVASFVFEDAVVIGTFRAKNELTRLLLKQSVSYSNTNVTITSPDRRFIYQAAYFNDRVQSLSGVTIIERDASSAVATRIEADSAEWNGTRWVLRNCRIFRRGEDGIVRESNLSVYESETLDEKPSIFRRMADKVEEMRARDAREYVQSLQTAGLPYQEALSWYHRKFSFAATPFVVVLIAGSVGGLFKRNFLFLSLLAALGIVVGYYVLQLVALTMARNGLLSPITGAWASLALFLGIGAALFRVART